MGNTKDYAMVLRRRNNDDHETQTLTVNTNVKTKEVEVTMSNSEILRIIEVTKRSLSIAEKIGFHCPAHVALLIRLQGQVNGQC